MSTPKNPLTRTLENQAEHFDRTSGAAVSLDGVLNRAGEIRRGRRMRATIAMAAVVLAIAVPVGIKAIDADPTAKEPVPASQDSHDHSQVTLDVPKAGYGPAIGYAVGEKVHLADGWEYSLDGRTPVALAELADGSFLTSTNDGSGNLQATYYPKSVKDGDHAVQNWPMEGGFAVSPGGLVAAFAGSESASAVTVVMDGKARGTFVRTTHGAPLDVGAVDGSCDIPELDRGCTVYANQTDDRPQVWAITEGSSMAVQPGLLSLVDITIDGRVAGTSSITDDGSCSQVRDSSATVLWQTCEHRFVQFSPDGKHLLASGPYVSGAGDSELAILDAQTGKPVLDLQTMPGAVITQMVWEDDDHVLAVVLENGKAGIVRFDLNGNRETALAPVPVVDDFVSPIKLAER